MSKAKKSMLMITYNIYCNMLLFSAYIGITYNIYSCISLYYYIMGVDCFKPSIIEKVQKYMTLKKNFFLFNR